MISSQADCPCVAAVTGCNCLLARNEAPGLAGWTCLFVSAKSRTLSNDFRTLCLSWVFVITQARNILLKSSGGAEGRPFVAKVADFGLSMRIDPNATHVSNVFQVRPCGRLPTLAGREASQLFRQSMQTAGKRLVARAGTLGHWYSGYSNPIVTVPACPPVPLVSHLQGTMTHMAPEVMLRGKLSRQSDVYAFGVLLWELYSGGHAFKVRALSGSIWHCCKVSQPHRHSR